MPLLNIITTTIDSAGMMLPHAAKMGVTHDAAAEMGNTRRSLEFYRCCRGAASHVWPLLQAATRNIAREKASAFEAACGVIMRDKLPGYH